MTASASPGGPLVSACRAWSSRGCFCPTKSDEPHLPPLIPREFHKRASREGAVRSEGPEHADAARPRAGEHDGHQPPFAANSVSVNRFISQRLTEWQFMIAV